MSTLESEISDMLYTSKNGEIHDSFEMSLLDDDEIPWERLPKLEALLVASESSETLSRALSAAKLLASWGDEAGLDFLEDSVDKRIDKLGNLNPHRLRNYDTTYEEILDAAIGFWARYCDRSREKGVWARKRVKRLIVKLIGLANELPFEIKALYDHLNRNPWPEIIEYIKDHLKIILGNESQNSWKIVDAINFFEVHDSEFVDQILRDHGRTRSEFLDPEFK